MHTKNSPRHFSRLSYRTTTVREPFPPTRRASGSFYISIFTLSIFNCLRHSSSTCITCHDKASSSAVRNAQLGVGEGVRPLGSKRTETITHSLNISPQVASGELKGQPSDINSQGAFFTTSLKLSTHKQQHRVKNSLFLPSTRTAIISFGGY